MKFFDAIQEFDDRSHREHEPGAGDASVQPERTRKHRLSIDREDLLSIRQISEAVTPKIPILWRTSLSSKLPYQRSRCQNCNENGHKESFTSSSTNQNPKNKRASWSTLAPVSNAVQLYVSMRYEATFLEKTIFKECYVTDRNINLMGLDWIDELNLI
ncbi:hypothetical protein ACTXT7_011248 [Hymenolepis weldensis]